MNRSDAGIGETSGDFSQAAKPFFCLLINNSPSFIIPDNLPTHHTNQICIQSFHPLNRSIDGYQHLIKVFTYIMTPVGDVGTQSIGPNPRLFKFVFYA